MFYIIDNLNYYSTYYRLVNATALTITTPTTTKTLIISTGTSVVLYAKCAPTMVDMSLSRLQYPALVPNYIFGTSNHHCFSQDGIEARTVNIRGDQG